MHLHPLVTSVKCNSFSQKVLKGALPLRAGLAKVVRVSLRVFILIVMGASRCAHAQNAPAPAFSLSWEVPAECASAPDTKALLGAAAGAARVVIKPVDLRWRLSVTFIAPMNGERTVDTDTCADATQAALLLLQLGARGQLSMPPL
ncbi:MAG: hypothetical protein K1X64_15960, partial [Myxococcaceae bacterium]|nr:hypothetical protein [Myxococcaceae bacterium]